MNQNEMMEMLLSEVRELRSLMQSKSLKRIKISQVADKIGFCDAKIYNMIKAGEFPEPQKDGKSSFWFEHDVDAWLMSRHKKRA